MTGSPQQICVSHNDTLSWSESPVCLSKLKYSYRYFYCDDNVFVFFPSLLESDPCINNPCSNGGTCIPVGDGFICKCTLDYIGLTCVTLVINLPQIPPLVKDEKYSISVIATLNSKTPRLTIGLFKEEETNSLLSRLALLRLIANQNITAIINTEQAGIYTINYQFSPRYIRVEFRPSSMTVFIKDSSTPNKTKDYFTAVGVQQGQLRKGCCNPLDSDLLSCPGSVQKVLLTAACQWNSEGATYQVSGVVFAEGNGLSLPVSIAGYQYSKDNKGSLFTGNSMCAPCHPNEQVCMQVAPPSESCYCYNFTALDTENFLNSWALGQTYIANIHSLLPSWIKLRVRFDSSMTSTFSAYDYLAPVVLLGSDIQDVKGCNQISVETSGIYSLLRYDKALEVEFEGKTYTYNYSEPVRTDADDTLCIAVNLCEGIRSPVHMQLSRAIQRIVVSQILSNFVDKGWSIEISTVTIFSVQIVKKIDTEFWNGKTMVKPNTIRIDLLLQIKVVVKFYSEHLNITFVFCGKVGIHYQVRHLECSCNNLIKLNQCTQFTFLL